MAGENQELRFKVLAQVVGAESIDKLKSQIGGLSGAAQGINSKIGGLATGLKALAGAFLVKEAIQFGKSLIDTGDELQALSEKTGIAVRDLSGFKTAAELGNTSIEAVEGGAKKLALAMVDASNGGKQASAAFNAVGVSVKSASGELRPTGDVIKDIADKFKNMKDGPEKAALAVKLFGKSGTELIPFLNQGAESLTKFGLAMSDDFAARSDQFNDSLTLLGNQFKNSLLPGIEAVLPVFQDIVNAFSGAPGEAEDTVTMFQVLGEAARLTAVGLEVFWQAFKNGIDSIVTAARVAKSFLTDFFASIGDSISTRAAQLKALASLDFEGASSLGADLEQRTTDRVKAGTEERSKLLDEFFHRSEDRAKEMTETTDKLLKNSLLFGDGTKDEILKRLKEATTPVVNKGRGSIDTSGLGGGGSSKNAQDYDRVKAFIELQQQENENRKEALQDINLEAGELAKVNEQRKFDLEIKKLIKGMNLSEDQKAQINLLREERLALVELQYEQQRSFGYGAKSFFREYLADATNTAQQAQSVLSTTFRGAEDALVGFVKTGKLQFRDLANAIVEELIRISIRRALAGLVANFIGGPTAGATAGATASASANGNIITKNGPLPLKTYANGGIANSPHVALFGEGSTPEAFVPLPDGRTIPVTMKGEGGGGGGVNINVTVNVESGKETVTKEGAGGVGQNLARQIGALVRQEMMQQKRPGGLLA